MKLRFSNGKNYALTFECNDLESFRSAALSALRSFRMMTERRVHQGEIHKTRSWFEKPELHVYSEFSEDWLGLGLLRSSPTSGWAYRDPFTIRFSTQADDLDEICEEDRALFERSSELFWQGVIGSWEWSKHLGTTLMILGDEIDKLICLGPLA